MKKNDGANLIKVFDYYDMLPENFSTQEKIQCPFHDDLNPSMIVNFGEGNYYCFGCGESGDPFDFVKGIEEKYSNNASDLESLYIYTKVINGEVPNGLDKAIKYTLKKKKYEEAKDYEELYFQAHDYYFGLRKVDWENPGNKYEEHARDYMVSRGFTEKALNDVKAKITYNDSYPIILPIFDNEDFKGWVCRTTTKEIEQKRKYLYNKGFSRLTTLAGNYKGEKFVYIVEGYTDMLKFRQYGINNVVAILGWKITDEQIQKLKDEGIENVVSALDNDKAGKKGSSYLREHFNTKRLKYLKSVNDPGDMTKQQLCKSINKTFGRKIYK